MNEKALRAAAERRPRGVPCALVVFVVMNQPAAAARALSSPAFSAISRRFRRK
jgi:hypothetical protein